MQMKDGRPCCPLCDGPPTIWKLRMPLWGHFCDSAGMNIYWTTDMWTPHQKLAEACAMQAKQVMHPASKP